jgi:tetratricopeptide (TPR) repeat protein
MQPMKRIITVFTLISLSIVGLFFANQALLLAKPSATATEMMLTANQLYEAGQYAQAAQGYQQLADQGFTDSALFYNLGNAYFKQSDYGRAILNYRRAEQLAPRDADIQANLNLARAQTVDQLDDVSNERGFFSNLAQLSQDWLTLNELAMAALGLWVLFAMLIIAFTSSRKGSTLRESLGYVLIVVSFALAVGLVGLGSRLYADSKHPEAVVVAQEVNVSSGPGVQYVTEFNLNNGTEVGLVEMRGSWARLALGNGELQGWVPANAIEAVAE